MFGQTHESCTHVFLQPVGCFEIASRPTGCQESPKHANASLADLERSLHQGVERVIWHAAHWGNVGAI
jgi:hypothetical protein